MEYSWRLRDIKIVMGYKPDLTIERVMEIFQEKFDYEMALEDEGDTFLSRRKRLFIVQK